MAERIGPYLVLRQLGAGPHGVVHEVVDEALGRRLAVKLLELPSDADAHVRHRFAAAAGALAGLASRHLVRVHAHGEDAGRPWVASALAGDDLGQLLRTGGPLPTSAALGVVAQVAAGLADAHQAGVTHGSIGASNVFLRRHEHGLAARLGDFSLLPAGDEVSSEEQVAADLAAMGRLLWTTLTGQQASAGQPAPQLRGTSPRQLAVNRILRATWSAGAGAGYGSADRLRDDLAWAASLPHAHRARRRRRVARPALGAALAGVAVAAVAAVIAAVLAVAPVDSPDRPAAARTPMVGQPVGQPPPAARQRLALAHITRALVDRAALAPPVARCTARHWVEGAGVDRLVAEGFLDDRLRYVDRPASTMSTPLRTAAVAAAHHCRPATPS